MIYLKIQLLFIKVLTSSRCTEDTRTDWDIQRRTKMTSPGVCVADRPALPCGVLCRVGIILSLLRQ